MKKMRGFYCSKCKKFIAPEKIEVSKETKRRLDNLKISSGESDEETIRWLLTLADRSARN